METPRTDGGVETVQGSLSKTPRNMSLHASDTEFGSDEIPASRYKKTQCHGPLSPASCPTDTRTRSNLMLSPL